MRRHQIGERRPLSTGRPSGATTAEWHLAAAETAARGRQSYASVSERQLNQPYYFLCACRAGRAAGRLASTNAAATEQSSWVHGMSRRAVRHVRVRVRALVSRVTVAAASVARRPRALQWGRLSSFNVECLFHNVSRIFFLWNWNTYSKLKSFVIGHSFPFNVS